MDREAALRAMDAVLAGPVPRGRWEDFETYWSCNQFGQDTLVGRPIARNGLYKQNTFSMFWTAEALLASWRATGDDRYLAWGRRTLDELSMAQQVWQPPFIYVPALGGFGVMNADAEWNDSRQSLFAELFMDYYRETGDPHLFERGVTALKASFTMMYAPENPRAKQQWEQAHPFFGPDATGSRRIRSSVRRTTASPWRTTATTVPPAQKESESACSRSMTGAMVRRAKRSTA